MDTTTSAIAKLIAEARERVFPAMYRPFNCSDCRKDVPALADTLEAVTRERDEAVAQILLDAKAQYDSATDSERYMADAIAKLGTELAAVAKERDAAAEALKYYAEPLTYRVIRTDTALIKSVLFNDWGYAVGYGDVGYPGARARAALEKLNAK